MLTAMQAPKTTFHIIAQLVVTRSVHLSETTDLTVPIPKPWETHCTGIAKSEFQCQWNVQPYIPIPFAPEIGPLKMTGLPSTQGRLQTCKSSGVPL